MRKSTMLILLALVLLAAWALAPPVATAADPELKATKHDFTSTGPVGSSFTGNAGQWCMTCHTPHGGNSTQLAWNQGLSTNATIGFGSSQKTTAGTDLPTNIAAWSGTTKFCLSCHDGSVAVGTSSHDPWTTPVLITDADKIVGSGGNLSGTHPVGVPYAGETSAYNSITSQTSAWNFETIADFSGSGVKLFKDPTTTARGIECATCHDPHNKQVYASAVKFLRVAPADLCQTCHVK